MPNAAPIDWVAEAKARGLKLDSPAPAPAAPTGQNDNIDYVAEAKARGLSLDDNNDALSQAKAAGFSGESAGTMDNPKNSTPFKQLQTGIEQAGSGLTGGYYDRVPAALAATVMYGANQLDGGDKKWGDLYNKSLIAGREQMDKRAAANPEAAFGGYVTGAIVNPVNKLGLVPTALEHGFGNTKGIDPINNTSEYLQTGGGQSAINLAVPLAAKGLAKAVAGGVSKFAPGIAEKVGDVAREAGYQSPTSIRLAKALQKGIPKEELDDAARMAIRGKELGAGDLPLMAMPGQNITGYSKVAVSNPSAAPLIKNAAAKLEETFGNTGKKTGEFSKGKFGQSVSDMYESLGKITIDKAGFTRLMKENPGAAKYIAQATKEAKTVGSKAPPTSFEIIKNARDLANNSNLSVGALKAVKEQFKSITSGAYHNADEANAILQKTRLASGGVRNQAAKTMQTARDLAIKDANTSPAVKYTVGTVGHLARGVGSLIGYSHKKIEDIIAHNPAAQKELVRLLSSPTKEAIEKINVKPTALTKMLSAWTTDSVGGVQAGQNSRKVKNGN